MVGSRPRILVVDDEEDIREYLEDLLQAENYDVVTTISGANAWELLQTSCFQLVISDIIMHQGNGLELLDRVRVLHPSQPAVVLISGYSRITVAEAYERGAAAYFPKPFKVDAFLQTVKRYLAPQHERWNRGSTRLEIDESTPMSLQVAMPNLLSAAFSASVLNIGQGGMFLAWGAELPSIGDVIDFEISFLKSKHSKFSGRGIVRWIRTERDDGNRLPGIGVEFVELSNDQISDIFEVLNFVQTREFIPRG